MSGLLKGDSGVAKDSAGISAKTFALNLATGLALFTFELTGFFLLKSAGIGRRIYQPKTYLVQDRLRVESIPVNPWKWIKRIFTIKDEELKSKCGLDGYFFIRLIRGLLVIFLPLMAIIVPILLPINYNGGKGDRTFDIAGTPQNFSVSGLDTLSWQNVAPTQTSRYWAHLVCALLAICWTLYRIYREKLHFIKVRQEFLTSPEHRLKASARTILVTNIPSTYQGNEELKALFDVFVDNDDRSKLMVWVNRDYRPLRELSTRRRKLVHALEKEELRILRMVNKNYRKHPNNEIADQPPQLNPIDTTLLEEGGEAHSKVAFQQISTIFEEDCQEKAELWRTYLKPSAENKVKLIEQGESGWQSISPLKFWRHEPSRNVPKVAWLRAEIARLTVQIEELLHKLDDETKFPRQNSAFIQFDRQMSAHMAFALTTHDRPGCMSPRFLDVAPHEIVWPNMGLTSVHRFIRTCIALILFVGMIIFWAIPATFLGFISQLDSIRGGTPWLSWLIPWPDWLISLISGPVAAILLALLIQLVVPALCRKLAVLIGAPTRSKREVLTQSFYFTFLFIELVLVTSISSSIIATIRSIIHNPATISATLANNLPKSANYFFNYLIIQALGFSGSVLFQYLRLLYITTIWPWFTQTPREEAFLQTTIPHQMWGNVYSLFTNFAAIGLIYSIISPLVLIFISVMFIFFWVAYRHNYYYVQRNKVDTHGLLFDHALSLLFAGIYVMEIALIGLFFLVRDEQNNVACKAQAIIMIVMLCLTGAIHWVLMAIMRPLRELLPVTLEDPAAGAERNRFLADNKSVDGEIQSEKISTDMAEATPRVSQSDKSSPPMTSAKSFQKPRKAEAGAPKGKDIARTAANARKMLSRLHKERTVSLGSNQALANGHSGKLTRRELGDQLGASLADYPDELTDLSPEERAMELQAAYQDPVTREPAPIIWIPQDVAGVSEDTLKHASKYGMRLQYSDTGAYLTKSNKCVITQPSPDVRSDWLLAWFL